MDKNSPSIMEFMKKDDKKFSDLFQSFAKTVFYLFA